MSPSACTWRGASAPDQGPGPTSPQPQPVDPRPRRRGPEGFPRALTSLLSNPAFPEQKTTKSRGRGGICNEVRLRRGRGHVLLFHPDLCRSPGHSQDNSPGHWAAEKVLSGQDGCRVPLRGLHEKGSEAGGECSQERGQGPVLLGVPCTGLDCLLWGPVGC